MTVATMKKAVGIVSRRARTEASGNMNEARLKKLSGSGVDMVSFGMLTHSVRAVDISMKID
jgi:nicotinate-nucleotide pyrophosphorylase (carboxylating)